MCFECASNTYSMSNVDRPSDTDLYNRSGVCGSYTIVTNNSQEQGIQSAGEAIIISL